MYLAIDIGNTLQKAAVFTSEGDMAFYLEEKILPEDKIFHLIQNHNISNAILASVGEETDHWETALYNRCRVLHFTHTTPLPIRIQYEHPTTLGLDRMAAAVGAHAIFPNENVLVIQAGTCLVQDFITADGTYLGGAISPGLEMRLEALHHFTHRLPRIEKQQIDYFIGRSTEQSILSGVIHGLADEINSSIERYTHHFGKLKIILTGGNKNDLEKSIKNTIFAAPNLVLKGLYNILIFNAKK
ncbi:MAG: type III pantothenate kinase [Bacteroidales bacterium]|nr:type III pantothenate kinase [Bacteroidales bacterium]